MLCLARVLAVCLAAFALPAGAWSNHTLLSYRAFEAMPEVAQAAPVTVEPLEAFLKAQESAIAELLLRQEQWARANMPQYAPRPDALVFKADPARNDAQRREAFVRALRISPLSRFALYLQADPRAGTAPVPSLAHDAVSFLPEQPGDRQKFTPIAAQEKVAALAVLASASDEPDYGLDINLWQDSPSDWGKQYGFGPIPFGNPALYFATQAPFHMGFYHQSWLIYKAAPFIQRTYPLMRIQQYSSLAALAFRSGHTYWGWRFTGLALHYIQDLTQPYHSDLAPGDSTLKLIGANTLAMAGFPGWRDDLIVLLSNRHLALEKFQNASLLANARAGKDTALEQALRRTERDATYPAWSELYARDTVSMQAHAGSAHTVETIVATIPPHLVSDPKFDFGVNEARVDLLAEIDRFGADKRTTLQDMVAELMGHAGAHSRNTVRGILKAVGR